MTIRLFEVGGAVRDRFLGIQSKDIDIAVEAESWEEMREFVKKNTASIFQERPQFFTIRAMDKDRVPKDFVLCRKDGFHSDGRHPDSVEIGTIFDDINRRDFTVNAIALDLQTGEILDPHNGVQDIRDKILRCVGNAEERFNEDALRILRAIRFSITKGFKADGKIRGIWQDPSWAHKISIVSRERTFEELKKCFEFDTMASMKFMVNNLDPEIMQAIFLDDLWLLPTLRPRK